MYILVKQGRWKSWESPAAGGCNPPNLPSNSCFGQWGWGEGFKPSEVLLVSPGLVQAAIACGSNY